MGTVTRMDPCHSLILELGMIQTLLPSYAAVIPPWPSCCRFSRAIEFLPNQACPVVYRQTGQSSPPSMTVQLNTNGHVSLDEPSLMAVY
jgi:hypothetical protein